MPVWGPLASVVCRRSQMWSQRRRHPRPANPLVGSADPLVGSAARSLLPSCLGGGSGVCPLPSPVCPPTEIPHPWWQLLGFCPPGATLPLRGCKFPVETRLPLSLPVGNPVGFPPLWRPCAPPPCPPLRRTRRPLQRPHSPCRCPALPRIRQPRFPDGLQTSPFASASPHGSPPLSPCSQLRRRLSQCCPCWPSRHPNARPHRFLTSSLAFPSMVFRPIPPPPWPFHLHLLLHRLIPRHSIQRFSYI